MGGLGVGKLIEWPVGTTMYGNGNEGVASRIKISDGSIGYVEYGFAKRLGLPMAVLQNKAGAFVEAS
jgi:phosphate transport system substrate-binding protein